jgi:MFS family permease
MENSSGTNRWYVLGLAAATFTFVLSMPHICMTVLSKEMSLDLGLSPVEIGVVWGMIPFAGLFGLFIGGLLADRYGAKRVLSITCILTALAGALRGFSGDFFSLAASTFLYGLLSTIMFSGITKTAAIWFSGRQLGVANAVLTTGFGTGFTLGAMISATVLSPVLGGWRSVFFLYGAISVVIGFLWIFTVKEVARADTPYSAAKVSLREAASHVLPIKSVWLMGLAMLGYVGCVQGMVGYLPYYLREAGWAAAGADGTLATFNGLSTVAAVPTAVLSDRIGLRKAVIIPVLVITVAGVALLPLANAMASAMVWIMMVVMGICRDGSMALYNTMIMEMEGLGPAYVGTAIGLMYTISRFGSAFSPPLGNSLTGISPGLPFFFWAAVGVVAIVSLSLVRETGRRRIRGYREH